MLGRTDRTWAGGAAGDPSNAHNHEMSPCEPFPCSTEPRRKGRSSTQQTWGFTQPAATEPRLRPLRAPWEPGSSHSTTDVGCLPACLISPSYNIITASGKRSQHSPGASQPQTATVPQARGWGNRRMLPCTARGCKRLCHPKQRCQDCCVNHLASYPGDLQTI